MNRQHKDRIADLDCIRIEGASNGPAVILIHGYGASQEDLAPLSTYMQLSDDYSWYFPNGPMEVIVGPGMSGQAWFQINVSKWEKLLQEGKQEDMSPYRPEGMDSSVDAMLSFYEAVAENHSKVILGGFSQGSMLALEVALQVEKTPKGLILWSGNLVDKNNLEKLLSKKLELPFIQAHGVNDVVLGYDGAKSLYNVLISSGLKGELIKFQGGHEIPLEVIEKTSKFISRYS